MNVRPHRIASACCTWASTHSSPTICKRRTSATEVTGAAPLTGPTICFPLHSSHTSPMRQGHTPRGNTHESIQPPAQLHQAPVTRYTRPTGRPLSHSAEVSHTASDTIQYSMSLSNFHTPLVSSVMDQWLRNRMPKQIRSLVRPPVGGLARFPILCLVGAVSQGAHWRPSPGEYTLSPYIPLREGLYRTLCCIFSTGGASDAERRRIRPRHSLYPSWSGLAIASPWKTYTVR